MLFRLAYLGVTNAFAMPRLLTVRDRAKDVEILALRHQIIILQRQLDGGRIRLTRANRALLAALLHRLPRGVLRRIRMLVRPETVLRWHRDLIAAHHARISHPRRVGRLRTLRSIRALVLRLARENSSWGYRRIQGELLVLGIKVAASTVWVIPHDAGVDPAPERTSQGWAVFLRAQAEGILAADFLETVTLTGARLYVLAVIEHLAMDLQDAGCRARLLIRDRDGKYPALFDAILADIGIQVVLTGVRIPRIRTRRLTCTDRVLGTYKVRLTGGCRALTGNHPAQHT